MADVPAIRVNAANEKAVNADGAFVLYWMTAFRRPRWNFALDRAIQRAEELGKPVLILEALRLGYRWASERLHRFIIEGMADNAEAFAGGQGLYYPYIETEQGHGQGLLKALAERSCLVVTDDYPAFFLPRMRKAAARIAPVLLEEVDSNGLYPLRATERVFTTAASFRRHLQKDLPNYLEDTPLEKPFAGKTLPTLDALPEDIANRWPVADLDEALGEGFLEGLELDHDVKPVAALPGGWKAAQKRLDTFLEGRLKHYADGRNQIEDTAASGLSPYLHFGHVSTHEIFARLTEQESWDRGKLPPKATGKRNGWWNMSEAAEAFIDEFVTWREIGYNMAHHVPNYEEYETLPDWALKTLSEHENDEREHLYTLEQFEAAETHDELWNAAQRELVATGKMHNYLRMLWGKKVLEWTPSARVAREILIELNNKYALDGRDPNSYSGIMWTLGRYDRAWGPERKIFGKVRFMSSDSTRRKYKVGNYIKTYAS